MITYQKKKRKEKNRGLTQFYFNLLILKTTHFHTQLITQFQPFFLLKKKNVRHFILFTSQLHSYHIRENRKDRGRKNVAEREGEGRWRSRVVGRKKPAKIGVHQAIAPRLPPHRQTGSDRLVFFFFLFFFLFFFFSFLVLIQLCSYNKNVFIL